MHVRKSTGSAPKSVSRKRSRAEAPVGGGQDDPVRLSILVSKAQRRKLKVLAATRGVTISEVVRQGIARFIESEA